MKLTPDEVRTLRTLACAYAEQAALPCQRERIALWQAHNARKGPRPLILADQLPWNELHTDDTLTNRVADPYWRGVETWLRQELYKWHNLKTDMVLDPYIKLPIPCPTADGAFPPRWTPKSWTPPAMWPPSTW